MRKLLFGRLTVGGWFAILICGALAALLSLFLRGGSLRLVVPVMFLLVVITVSHVFDRLASIISAAVACIIFAVLLFEPYGSLAIQDASDRLVLSCFGLAALAVVLLSPESNRRRLAHTPFRRY